MRAEFQRIDADARNPLADQSRVLSGGQAAIDTASASEQELARATARDPDMFVNRVSRLLGQLESHRTSRLLLTNRSAVERVTIGGHVINANGYHVATAQLAVDG